jgi:hypothetical protein
MRLMEITGVFSDKSLIEKKEGTPRNEGMSIDVYENKGLKNCAGIVCRC